MGCRCLTKQPGLTCQDVLQHAGEGILRPRASPGNVAAVEICAHQQEQETLELVFWNHLAQVDCGSGGVGYPRQDLKGEKKTHLVLKLKEN